VNGSQRPVEQSSVLYRAHVCERNIHLSPALMQRNNGATHPPPTHKRRLREEHAMGTRFAIRPLYLRTGELFSITDGEGFAVVCLEGSVWITQSDDARDIVLGAGQTFAFDKPGLALVYANVGPAALVVQRSAPPPPPLSPYFWDMRNARHLPPTSAGL
jgi:Protein of unknown function (DUF2917)